MHTIILSQQVRSFDSKGVNFHLWISKINFHKWHDWFVPKIFLKKVHRDPYNLPLKPFKEGLQRCPPKVPRPNQLPKKPLNMLGTPKCKRPKTSPKSAWKKTKVKKFHPKNWPKSAWTCENIFVKPARMFFKSWKNLATMTPNLPQF